MIDAKTGEPGGMGASFKRNLPLIIPVIPLVIAIQMSKGQRIGDGWANTKVILKNTRPIRSSGRMNDKTIAPFAKAIQKAARETIKATCHKLNKI